MLQAQYTENKKALQLHLYLNLEQLPEEVRFAVWSENGDQEDLQWFTAQEQMGTWNCAVDLAQYPADSALVVHAYGVAAGETEFLNGCVIQAAPVPSAQE